MCSDFERQGSLRRIGRPAGGIADRAKRMAVEGRGAKLPKSFEVIGRGVTFVPGEAVLGKHGVPLFHASVAVCLGQNGSSGDGNAARVAFDERLLLDENIE